MTRAAQIEPTATASAEEAAYRRRTPASYRFFLEAREHLPGGDSRSTLFYRPYPAVMDRGQGCRVWDLDGNRLLDFTGNHSSLIHGYDHPRVLQAVRAQTERGTAFPGGTLVQARFARHLTERVGSLELVRFTNSGTEAAMFATRAARAFTGRPRVAKAEGGYHGSADEFMVSTHPPAAEAGEPEQPRGVPATLGLAPGAAGATLVIPFNDAEGATRLIHEAGDELAAVVIEPVMGSAGMIPAEPEYLAALREATRARGVLLIFDEVVSLRVAYGGAEEHFGVRPDLTVLGKLIGGGFPLGAFGGRRDIMALFDPSHGRPAVPHPGSYNANPVSLAAGLATLEALTPEAVAELGRLGTLVRSRLRESFAEAGVAAQVTGLGSLFGIHLTTHAVRDYRSARTADAACRHALFLGLYNEGVLIDPRGVGTLSTAVGEGEVGEFIEAVRAVLGRGLSAPHG